MWVNSTCFRIDFFSRRQLTLSRIPIRGRKRDSPEKRRRLDELQRDFSPAFFARSHVDHAAGKLLDRLRIYEMDLLASLDGPPQFHQAAVCTYGDGPRVFLELHSWSSCTHEHGDSELHALAAPAVAVVVVVHRVQSAPNWIRHGPSSPGLLASHASGRTNARA